MVDFKRKTDKNNPSVKVKVQDIEYPEQKYYNSSSVNKAARGIEENKLYIGGGHPNIDLDLTEHSISKYGKIQVDASASGHVIEIDDTEGSERVLIKHRLGSGIDCRADGTVIISSRKHTIRLVGGSEKVIVDGEGELVYQGNLNLKVAGDFNLDVGGTFNVKANNYSEIISENVDRKVYGNVHEKYVSNVVNIVNGTLTNIVLGDDNNIVSGSKFTQGNDIKLYSGTSSTFSSKTSTNITALSTNMIASSMTIIGDSGTMGGPSIVNYGSGAKYSTGVTAPSFHGSLKGTADQAIIADETNFQNYLASQVGSKSGYSNTNTAQDSSYSPTSQVVTDGLDKSSLGRKKVLTDPDDLIKNSLDKTAEQNISKKELTVSEIRSKFRNPKVQEDEKFEAHQIAAGLISTSYGRPMPSKVLRQTDKEPSTIRGKTPLGKAPSPLSKTFVGTTPLANKTYLVDPLYDPNSHTNITMKKKLSPYTTIGTFVGGHGDKGNWEALTKTEKEQAARNFYLQAEVMRTVQENDAEFQDLRLVVVEGLYTKGPNEPIEVDSINDMAQSGRVVVYELHGTDGKIDHEKTYDLAVYWKDNIQYEKMILDYDTLDGDLNTQIIMIMPTVPSDYKLTFKNELETHFNNKVMGTNELIECGI